jgi:excisionase family DNA binding protein
MQGKTALAAALRGLDNIGPEPQTRTVGENGARTSSHPHDPPRAAPRVTPTPLEHELLTVHDAARFLNVTISWVYEHTRRKAEDRLPFVKLGKYIRFDQADLRAYVDRKRRAFGHPADRR